MKLPLFLSASILTGIAISTTLRAQEEPPAADPPWEKHVVFEGFPCATANAADYTGDGKVDIVASTGSKIRLFAAPDWKESVLYQYPQLRGQCIHSEVMDVDGDGDFDYIGGQARGPVFWLENPGAERATQGFWTRRIVDPDITGYHCLLKADVNNDGKLDILINNFAPSGPLADSLTWQEVPEDPHNADRWVRHIFAKGDARGGSHYFGFGDLDGDGWGEIAVAAKGKPFEDGNWYAFWTNPGEEGVEGRWKKTVIAENETAATNILPADVNRDGKVDFIATHGHDFGVLWFEAPDWKRHEIHNEPEGPHSLTVADLDQDGDIDAATCAKDSQWVMWYENDGKGNFTLHRIDSGQAAYDIRSIDIDGDGDLDLLLGGQNSKNVVWYSNPLK